jgi:predicted TIM-barrel fold metal-dependent hydrolase
VSPVIEAFGFQRIIFGSSPCPSSTGSSIASDWYELAKESLSELGVEQDVMDGVFGENAKRVYGPA